MCLRSYRLLYAAMTPVYSAERRVSWVSVPLGIGSAERTPQGECLLNVYEPMLLTRTCEAVTTQVLVQASPELGETPLKARRLMNLHLFLRLARCGSGRTL